MTVRVSEHGLDRSSPTQALLSSRAFAGALQYDEATANLWLSDGTTWRPVGDVRCVYDFAVSGGAAGDKSMGLTLPPGTIVTGGVLQVGGNFTGGASATFAIKGVSAGDILGATALGNLTTSALIELTPSTAATAVVVGTGAAVVTATIASGNVTAGNCTLILNTLRPKP